MWHRRDGRGRPHDCGRPRTCPEPARNPDSPPPRGLIGQSLGEAAAGLLLRRDGEDLRIDVLGAANAVLLSLGPFPEEDAIATWRGLAASSGLPLVLPAPDGGLDHPFPQLGRVLVGRVRGRRRLVILNGRRPRFLVRRKFARLPPRPLVYRECELAGGRGA